MHAPLVMSASNPSICGTGAHGGRWERDGELYNLLFGEPLCARVGRGEARPVDQKTVGLDPILKSVVNVMKRDLYSNKTTQEPLEQAELEWNRVVALPHDTYAQVAAKRAALLFALWRYKDIRLYYSFHEPKLVLDLENRILPLIMPVFVGCQAQAPDSLVLLTAVLTTMWDPRDVGAIEYKRANLPEIPRLAA